MVAKKDTNLRVSREILAARVDAQRAALWRAQAVIDTVAEALVTRFGGEGSWPGDVPEYRLALEGVSASISGVTAALEPDVVLERSDELAELAEEAQS